MDNRALIAVTAAVSIAALAVYRLLAQAKEAADAKLLSKQLQVSYRETLSEVRVPSLQRGVLIVHA